MSRIGSERGHQLCVDLVVWIREIEALAKTPESESCERRILLDDRSAMLSAIS